MSHFARVVDNQVVQVIAVEQSVLNMLGQHLPGNWIQTSYNTRGNVHYGPNRSPDGGTPIRANFAAIGYTYDPTHDVFYAPQPFPSWTLNTSTWSWEAPTSMPSSGGPYVWNESSRAWVVMS